MGRPGGGGTGRLAGGRGGASLRAAGRATSSRPESGRPVSGRLVSGRPVSGRPGSGRGSSRGGAVRLETTEGDAGRRAGSTRLSTWSAAGAGAACAESGWTVSV